MPVIRSLNMCRFYFLGIVCLFVCCGSLTLQIPFQTASRQHFSAVGSILPMQEETSMRLGDIICKMKRRNLPTVSLLYSFKKWQGIFYVQCPIDKQWMVGRPSQSTQLNLNASALWPYPTRRYINLLSPILCGL